MILNQPKSIEGVIRQKKKKKNKVWVAKYKAI